MTSSLTPQQQKALNDVLASAVMGRDAELAKMAIGRGASPLFEKNFDQNNSAQQQLLDYFIRSRFDEKMAEVLFSSLSGVDERMGAQKKTALMSAVSAQNIAAVKWLIARGADPLAQDSSGNVALAATSGIYNEESKRTLQRLLLDGPAAAFNAAAAKPADAATGHDIVVGKPFDIAPKGNGNKP